MATGRDPGARISEECLAAAIIWFVRTRSVNSVGSYVAALQWFHTSWGYGPLPRGPIYTRVKRGLQQLFTPVDVVERKFALTLDHLYAIYNRINLHSFTDARNWAATTLGWFGLLRIREFCDARLRVRHVSITDEGLALTIAFSKTDRRPHTIRIARRNDSLCPVGRHTLSLILSLQLQPVTQLIRTAVRSITKRTSFFSSFT